jgi:tRNA threonylcarbamoyl adenosine modification protein (Sua5/YciO/YrdC/YwlC family)
VAGDVIQRAIGALRRGEPVLLPADGVYGLCASADGEAPARRLYELKGRTEAQPTALIAASVEALFECVPELRGRSGLIVRTLLPGPYTLVLANPGQRYRWLTGTRPDALGVRVPLLPRSSQRVLDAVRAVVATSANEPGEPAAASLDEVPERVRLGCAAELDGGRLSGEPSTVIDFTGPDAVVLRKGSASPAEAIARVAEALAASDLA